MEDKKQLIAMLDDEFDRWDALLAGLSEEQIVARQLPGGWSIKDTLAHLWAWQQRSVARMEAALQGHDPIFPRWPEHLDPETDEEPDKINAWIFESNRDRSWESVYGDWRSNYLRFVELGRAVPEKDLLETGHYTWLKDYPLAAVLSASYEHHHVDHLEPLQAWLREHGIGPANG